MKLYQFSLFFSGILLMLTGCKQIEDISECVQTETYVATVTTESFSAEYPLSMCKVPYLSGQHYEILSNLEVTICFYRVFNQSKKIIDHGYFDPRAVDISFEENDGILSLKQLAGGSLQYRYYDVSNSRVSQFFNNPKDSSHELVAYFSGTYDDLTLIVQNMFDSSDYYQEIRRDFSTAGSTIVTFQNDGTQLEINDITSNHREEITETIDLL